MKKKYLIISIIAIAILTSVISIYSYNKFKTYNFILSIQGVLSIKEEKTTYGLKDNIILMKNSFKETYLNYLTQIYENKEWTLEKKEDDTYVYCSENYCDTYKLYQTSFFKEKYTILVAEFET